MPAFLELIAVLCLIIINCRPSLQIQDDVGTSSIREGLQQLAKSYGGHVWFCTATFCQQLDLYNASVLPREKLDVTPWTTPWTQLDFPSAVLQPRDVSDVQSSLRFAQQQSVRIAVKSGGHSVNVAAQVPGGITLDMGLMTATAVDVERQTISVQTGVKAGGIYSAAFAVGHYVPLGACPHVGQGITLHGGFGNAARARGPSCDSVLSMQVVLANGTLLDTSADVNEELFWGLRGAGSLFGVVTEIQYRMYSLKDTTGGVLVWDDDPQHSSLSSTIKFMRDVAFQEASLDLTCLYNGNSTYTGDVGQTVAPHVVCSYLFHDGRPGKMQEDFFSPLTHLATPSYSAFGTMDYASALVGSASWCSAMVTTPGLQAYWLNGGMSMADLSDDSIIDDIIQASASIPISSEEDLSYMLLQLQGGQVSSSTAPVGSVKSDVVWNAFLNWKDNHNTARFVAAAAHIRQKLGHTMRYVYANQQTAIDPQFGNDLSAAVGGVENLQRLCRLKVEVDPHDVFTRHMFPGFLTATCKSFGDSIDSHIYE